VTPARFVFAVALVAAGGAAAYGLFIDRSGRSIPLTVAGLAVLGVTLAMLSLWLARGGVRAGRSGGFLRALAAAFIGGVCALAASAALGAAVIFGLLSISA
jgi:hypothetical protein